jgi:septal ring factor EnvC (AmiA/AmiB activator)
MSLPIAPLPPGLEGHGTFRVVDEGPATDGFAARRGQLATPLLSMRGIRDARRDDGPGLELITQPGSMVRAAADGRVAFARPYGSYGPMVILEHDDGYYTVYGGLGRFAVDVGDGVAAGAPIGSVGGDALFFEVRRGTRSLDARSWLGF